MCEREIETRFDDGARRPDAKVHCGAIPRGSVLLFNANVSHRGTANLSPTDRPVLVLDTSPRCGASDEGFAPLPSLYHS